MIRLAEMLVLGIFVGFFIGMITCVPLVFKIVSRTMDEILKKIYDRAVSETIERLHGDNKKNH